MADPLMALAASADCLALLLILFFITIAFGSRVLEIAGLTTDQPLDYVLFSAGVGFATLQLFLGILAFVIGLTLWSVIALLVLMALAGERGWKTMLGPGKESWKNLTGVFQTSISKAFGICIVFFAGLEALISTAPLTGSDAMHYHFTVPLLQIGKPEQPIFWLTHSFFLGLGHELIGMGLVLGGDRLALLLIFMGGCLTAVALFQLARRLMPIEWALSSVLVFFMTPMVFWQISTAGSPDIWMGFYVLLVTLALTQVSGPPTYRWIILAGAYSGAAASIKYTGWIIPAVIVLCVLGLTRSLLWTALCSIAALIAGMFPLLRNFLWTGDPFFPFLERWIGKKIAVNLHALAFIQADVHSHAFSIQPLHVFYFLGTMGLMGADYGLGNYLGPIVFSFMPLLIFCGWRMRLVRLAGILWFSMLLANALTTQMARFLLPAYPLALVLAVSGAAVACRKGGAMVRFGCTATLVVFGLFCLASDSLYAKEFLPVSLGLESKGEFLDRMAPDYQAAKFINSALANGQGKTLVFFRHLYYLRVPYVNGDPESSWMMNPDWLNSPQMLLTFLKEQDIRWVVKSPEYPWSLAGIFEQCEKEGKFVPEARGEVEVFTGNSRILHNREMVQIVLMRVAAW
jgi:4-amino-4-deoxy-L-arabinose transferase-like glycosyltransferase